MINISELKNIDLLIRDKKDTDIFYLNGSEEFFDWSKVPVDTKVQVNNSGQWENRHFAKYENGVVYCWVDGKTSFTKNSNGDICPWGKVRLYKEGEE